MIFSPRCSTSRWSGMASSGRARQAPTRSARPYPLPVRVLSFEAEHSVRRDPSYSADPVDCYAARLRAQFREAVGADGTDAEGAYRRAAITALRKRTEFFACLNTAQGIAWGRVQRWLSDAAPPSEVVGDRFDWARAFVRP